METHWRAPCCAVAVLTVPPEGSVEKPRVAIAFFVLAPPPMPIDATFSRDAFQLMSRSNATTPPHMHTFRRVRSLCCCTASALKGLGGFAGFLIATVCSGGGGDDAVGVVDWRRDTSGISHNGCACGLQVRIAAAGTRTGAGGRLAFHVLLAPLRTTAQTASPIAARFCSSHACVHR